MASKLINVAGLLPAREQGIKKGQPMDFHLFSVCCMPIAGLLHLEYHEPKAGAKCKANTRRRHRDHDAPPHGRTAV